MECAIELQFVEYTVNLENVYHSKKEKYLASNIQHSVLLLEFRHYIELPAQIRKPK